MPAVNRKVLPGFSLTLGYTVFYLSVLVLIPLAACFWKASSGRPSEFWACVWNERAKSAYWLTFSSSLIAAVINAVMGLSWRGRWSAISFRQALMDALVDIPFALPTAVAGLVFANLFVANAEANGWYGRYLVPWASMSPIPSWGSSQCWFLQVWLYGAHCAAGIGEYRGGDGRGGSDSWGQSLANLSSRDSANSRARSADRVFAGIRPPIGEYGSVIFISGNMPFRTGDSPGFDRRPA